MRQCIPATVETYVSALRRRLDVRPGLGRRVVATEARGYRLIGGRSSLQRWFAIQASGKPFCDQTEETRTMANPMITERRSPVTAAGEGRSAWRTALEAGAAVLQDMTPLKDFDIYVVGLHCAKDEPGMQMEAHHYCRQVNQDLLQCVLFDGNTKDANLIGIEYIVSERLFDALPEHERDYWHPHNYEILSGQLTAPGLPAVAERAFLKQLINSYGKTWHTWHTGRHDGEPGDRLPLGDPKLMWSFNRDGEADERLKHNLQQQMGIDEADKRAQRRAFTELAHPQRGVDAMADQFDDTTPLPGVVEVAPRR